MARGRALENLPLEEICDGDENWGSDAVPRDVTITYLQMLDPPAAEVAQAARQGVRIERACYPTAELARWLYAVVGGPYRWYERLGWPRARWQAELDEAGSEIWMIYCEGTPAGYCQLHAAVTDTERGYTTETEILYFGLMDWAQGKGLGRFFLETIINRAWTLHERHPLPPVSRVWVHTCDLDGPYALANYRARGLEIFRRETHREVVLKSPLDSWEAMFAR